MIGESHTGPPGRPQNRVGRSRQQKEFTAACQTGDNAPSYAVSMRHAFVPQAGEILTLRALIVNDMDAVIRLFLHAKG